MKSNKLRIQEYSILAGALLLGSKINYGQVIYTDLDPDADINTDNSIIYLDLDNNLINDFKVTKYSLSNSNTSDIICYQSIYLGIGRLAIGNSIVGFENDYGADLIEALNYGATVNNLDDFNFDSWQLLSLKRQEVSCHYPYPPVEPWVYFNLGGWFTHQDEDQYIGVKFKNEAADCYYYGWIRCVISDSLEKITIKDYAYNSNCGAGIQAGMLTSNINEPIVPDPIIVVQYEMLNIAVTGSYIGSTIDITNMLGQILKEATISAAATQINLNGLSAGIYLVSIKKDEQTYVKQVVVN